MPDSQITVSILSFMLEDRLIKTLQGIPASTSLPLNLCLRVQGAENINDEKKQEILEAANNFINKDIFFTDGNEGTGKPRSELTPRSATTPFVLITDNDMDFPSGGIDKLYEFMTDPANTDIAIANLVHNRQSFHNYVVSRNGKLQAKRERIDLSHPHTIYPDLIGSASMLARQEVALTPNIIDPRYIVGVWDYDFCLNVRRLGWKLATLVDKDYIAVNDKSYKTKDYQKVRHNSQDIKNSIKLYRQKWNLSPVWYKRAKRAESLMAISKDMILSKSDWKQRIKDYQKFVQNSNNLSEALNA